MYSGYEYCYGVQEVFTNLYSTRHHKDDTAFFASLSKMSASFDEEELYHLKKSNVLCECLLPCNW